MTRGRNTVAAAAAVLALLALSVSACVPAARGVSRSSDARPAARAVPQSFSKARQAAAARVQTPAVQLVESVPVETQLGNPALPRPSDVWLEMIRSARRRIDLEGFYLSTWPGEPLEAVIAALGDAARRGVQVRILLDAGMHRTYPLPADSLARVRNFAVRTIDMRRIAGGIQHAKYFLVDGAEVFLGSQNFDWRALKHIHELGVRVRDRRVAQAFGAVFDWDWNAADTLSWKADAAGILRPAPPPQRPLAVPIAIVQTPGDTAWTWPSYSPKPFLPDTTRDDLEQVVRVIDAARHEVVVQTLTYTGEEHGRADSTLDQALRRAAGRGVRVRLIVSDWVVNGRGIGWLQRLAGVPNAEIRLSTVPDWSGGYIPFARVEHCKYMVADTTWTWIGTSNWGPGYFFSSRNLALTFRNRPLASEARRVFETSWTATSAAPLRVDFVYPPKVQGETPPPGKTKYGG